MNGTPRKKSDLGDRTTRFAEAAVAFAKRIPITNVNASLVRQLVRASTSIGANYAEANDAESGPDFCHKMAICRKEAGETKYWLRIVASAEPELKPEARALWREANGLHLIFCKIVKDLKLKDRIQ